MAAGLASRPILRTCLFFFSFLGLLLTSQGLYFSYTKKFPVDRWKTDFVTECVPSLPASPSLPERFYRGVLLFQVALEYHI